MPNLMENNSIFLTPKASFNHYFESKKTLKKMKQDRGCDFY